ncbi:MFS transporter [Carboxydocella sp. ULO1]|uniref:MFS transporter n=2 Tax=unclassified Carboxydocella TaxID=2685367 RepID=UPI0009AF1D1E|nr:MFS transporter [Carboxydocella sp. ULO1]GAW28034.1 multidrug transporter [Carboxydocella sp. ULO1]
MWQGLRLNWQQASATLRFLLLAQFFGQMGRGMFEVLYNLLLLKYGYTTAFAGQVIGLSAAVTAVMMPLAGRLGDRRGRRTLLILGLAGTGLFLVARAYTSSRWPILGLAVLSGLTYALVQVNLYPAISELTGGRERSDFFSLVFALQLLGGLGGSILGGAISDLLQFWQLTEKTALQLVLTLAGLLMILGGWLQSRSGDWSGPGQDQYRQDQSLAWSREDRKAMLGIIGFAALIGIGAGLFIPYMNIYFRQSYGASYSAIGLITGLGQATTAWAVLLGNAWAKRWGFVRTIIVLQLASLPFAVGLGYTPNLLWAALFFLARMALMNAAHPLVQNITLTAVAADKRGLASSLNGTLYQAGWAVGGPLTGYLLHWGGYQAVFWGVGLLYLVGTGWFYLFFGRPLKEEGE